MRYPQMSFTSFADYLSTGGFFICETRVEFDSLVAENKTRAVFHYACPAAHISKISVAGFRNKRRIKGNDFNSFCAQCKTTVVNKDELPVVQENPVETRESVGEYQSENETNVLSSDVCVGIRDNVSHRGNQEDDSCSDCADSVQPGCEDTDEDHEVHPVDERARDSVRGHRDPDYGCDQAEDCRGNVQADDQPYDKVDYSNDRTSSGEDDAHSVQSHTPNNDVYESITAAYAHKEPEFFACYAERRQTLYNKYSKISGLMFDERNVYTDMAITWLLRTRNVLSREYVKMSDIRAGSVFTVPSLNLTVEVQTTVVYNLDPALYYKKYSKSTAPLFVLFFNNEEHVDTWYFIPGKKIYSVRNRHAFDPHDIIPSYKTTDDVEYYYFEKAIFEMELDMARG